jgi:phosphonate transport system substrate-binding protein
MIKDDPGLADKVRIIMKSEEFGNPPLVVNPRINPAIREHARQILLAMHDSPEGREILAGLGIDRYEFPDASLYDDVRQCAALWNPR